MDIEDIVAEKRNPALLDKLAFCTDSGQLMGMFGLGAELFVKPRDRTELRLDMFRVQDDYYRLFKDRINRCFIAAPSQDGRFEEFRERVFAGLKTDRTEWPEFHAYSNMLFEKFTHPEFPHNANTVTPILSQFLIVAKKELELSGYDCYLPVSNDGGKTLNFALLRDAVLRWCNLLHPAHGNAGFCVFVEPNTQTGQKYAYPFLQRFPGLDIHCPSTFSIKAESTFNRIKCVNWLTVLDARSSPNWGASRRPRLRSAPSASFIPTPAVSSSRPARCRTWGTRTATPTCWNPIGRWRVSPSRCASDPIPAPCSGCFRHWWAERSPTNGWHGLTEAKCAEVSHVACASSRPFTHSSESEHCAVRSGPARP